MELLELKQALEYMREIVTDSFAKRKKPITGAALKAAILRRAEESGRVFQERALGFRSFMDFVSSHKELVIEKREVGDFVVNPPQAGLVIAPVLQAESPISGLIKNAAYSPHIREDIWFAFMSFAKPGFRREYNREADKVLYPPESSAHSTGVLIEPITKEQQIEWRKEFASTVDEGLRESLMQALSARNPLREFSISLKLQPDLLKRWNSFVFSKVHPVISAWAEQNKIPNEVWLPQRPDWEDSQRRALYRLLDRIPIEELLETKVPLGWFFRDGKK